MSKFKIAVTIILILITADLVYLNWHIFYRSNPTIIDSQISSLEKRLDSLIRQNEPAGTNVIIDQNELVTEIATKAANLAVQSLDTKASSSTKTIVNNIETTTSGVTEYYIPLGQGSTQSRSWVDAGGATATVDSTRYQSIETVYFEASLRSQNGQVYARLVDATDGLVYYDSQIFHDRATASWITSSPISLHFGNRVYKVQLKTSAGEPGYMDQARLRILVK